MLPGPPALTCFVLLAHVKKFHRDHFDNFDVRFDDLVHEELKKLMMSVAVSLYPGDSHAGLLRSSIRDRRIYFLASAFVFGPCRRNNPEYWVTHEVLCYTRSRTNS